jgi:hypothetical protein
MFPIQDVLPDPHKRGQNEPVIGGYLNHVESIRIEGFGVMLVS